VPGDGPKQSPKPRFSSVLSAAPFAAVILVGAIASACGTTKASSVQTVTKTVTVTVSGATQAAPAETEAGTVPAAPTEAETEPAAPAESSGQRNARQSAEDYLTYQAFSRTGLIKQLKFEGFSKAEAEYAVEAIKVDWKQEAVQMAKDYLGTQSFSRSGLIEQLEFDGFTPEQAEYGVQKAY